MRMVEEGIWDAATTYKRALKRYPSDQVTVIAQLPEPLTGDTVFVDDHFLNDHPAFVRAFVSAYKTGWNRDLPASGARIPDLRVFTVEDASEADFEIVRDKLSAVENMASLEHRIYGQWPGLRNNRRVVRILFWLARNQQTLQTLGITVLVLIPVGFVILVLRRRMRRMQAVGVKDRELLLQEADARLASKMNEMTELEAVLELSLKETDVYKDEGTKSELKVVQLRNEMEALRRDRDDVAADLQNEQAKLERMSSKRGADKDLSQLRRRLQRLYPPVECSEQVLKRILDLNPDQLSSFEHELQVLCFQPDKAQTRCKVQGTEASEVGFGHDGRFYYTKIGNTVKLLNVGNKSTQKKDIKGLRS
jgi:hypothetical protein